MHALKTDDFRIERDGAEWIVTFTPTGARFFFGSNGMETRVSETDLPPEDAPTDYDPLEVERMAARIAYLVRNNSG
ncbi:hypothetical protein [Methylocystis parvus]|uniref:Uncharacterized protein n=1 Tax=Methylocystis parvus TaxID=134 RepID=A0A6B8M7U0_9HYPH|nr:hypothetical protein [Methylocystis parvus]QGM98012.1 hypothetical protein F7D14_11345 [Methylocystis parvus]WBK01672.1 hypothetical protein MMG94_08225 [Methylocystis parvus OBBP]